MRPSNFNRPENAVNGAWYYYLEADGFDGFRVLQPNFPTDTVTQFNKTASRCYIRIPGVPTIGWGI